jgi:hypothetical protein
MSETPIGMREVKPLLQARALELARYIAPMGRVNGRVYVAPNPARNETRGSSFVIWLKGAVLSWKEYDAGDGEKGDVFDLIVYAGFAPDKTAALRWAKQWLGLEQASAEDLKKAKALAAIRHKEAQAKIAADDEAAKKWARGVFLAGEPLTENDLVWKYLTIARRIPLRRLTKIRPLNSLRFAPRLKYIWPKPDELDDYYRSIRPKHGVSYHPAMLAAFSPVNGGPSCGAHRTWLRADGLGKADVPDAKRMGGRAGGCIMHLWRGETGKSDRELVQAGQAEQVRVSEGIEDCLSIACADPTRRCKAAGSLSLLEAMDWPKVASELLLFADNDWNTPAALKAFHRACERLAQSGPVKVARASGDAKDANDLLKGIS